MARARNSRYDEDYRLLLTMLVDCRLLSRLTQAEIAERTGIGQSVVSRLESGVIRLDVQDLLSYLDAVGVELQTFLVDFDRRRRKLARAEGA